MRNLGLEGLESTTKSMFQDQQQLLYPAACKKCIDRLFPRTNQSASVFQQDL